MPSTATSASSYTSLGLSSNYSSWFGGMASTVGHAITGVLPVALPIAAAIIAVTLGIRLIRKVAH